MPTAQARCCPPGPDGQPLTYIDSSGLFYNTYLNTYMTVLSWTGGPAKDVFGKCAITQVAPAAYGVGGPNISIDPIDCPCCPDGYVYEQWRLLNAAGAPTPCQSLSAPYRYVEPTMCITCICPDPPPPPVCESCTTTQGTHIAFSWDPTVKHCKECSLDNDTEGLGGFANTFLPLQLTAPFINFKLKM